VSDRAACRIEVAGEARRDLHRLPSRIAAAVLEFLTGPLAADPARVSKPLAHELTGYRSARRGDYRILIRIDEDAHTVLVVRVDHRADVYRPR
jgi:mRNA-degrading endonuclease RelE of RelBE toxin-antitoxin system